MRLRCNVLLAGPSRYDSFPNSTSSSPNLAPPLCAFPTPHLRLAICRCHTRVKFCLREVGGGEKARAYWHRSANGVSAYVFVIDSAKKERFPEAIAALKFFLQQEEVSEKPLIVLANKQVCRALKGCALAG